MKALTDSAVLSLAKLGVAIVIFAVAYVLVFLSTRKHMDKRFADLTARAAAALCFIVAMYFGFVVVAHASPAGDVKPHADSTNGVLMADEKSGAWWGYSEQGGVTICSRDGVDEMSPGWTKPCKSKAGGTPAAWQIAHFWRSFGGGSPGLLGLVD
ncbi:MULTISPECIES: hypothetical protein [Burkholderia]|jgi:hypothetical protein|uniref:Uncharacterized protein n=1 Tax=Burkholderia contaminans TaxID=488447 RepID=A0A1E3FN44_9BURK|nr:hypothetical protein [Burkholderia contaminans]ELK7724831.1 hypothetical protein [Burkholderia cenocepacia]UTP27796.1 hypothetical protein NMB33_40635 [Burkholderia sp. FXe9]HBN6128322.1 hypothetical protein [Clostridioides difficile]MBH9693708.1 hypothetical protein [Burkholderia contaminans]MBK1905465.1 hypothetical protein [Burkholderia contaminans]